MHVRCPHCHQPIELVEDVPLEHIDCPSCGSHFSMLGNATVGYQTGEGRTVGHFKLVERLGMGHFGTVWKARDLELDRTVAVKIPRQEQLSPGDTELFLREARAAAQLHHPNIVSVHEVGRDRETVFIVSDLVHGVTLADWLTGQRLTKREAAQLCLTIAEALHHAHQSGVIHRDLKPSNIMIDADGQPHLMDFGLAKREAAEITMTHDGRILGTPAYMSPEQARGDAHRADARSDIYSLGTILFELLTGELPFRGNARMLAMQIIQDEPPSPRKLDASIPRDLETICLKCLEKSPERRYATARHLADELRRYLAGQPIDARPVGRLERSWRWCRRNPVVAGLTAAVASVLIAGTVVSSYFAAEANKRAESETAAKHDALTQQRLAVENAQRAEENARRADKNAEESQTNAKTAIANAQRESSARRETERQLRTATAERLAGLSYSKRSESPDLGLLLAVESGNTTRLAGEDLLPSSHQALLDSLASMGGRTLDGHQGGVTGVAFSADSRWVVTGSADGKVRSWDIKVGDLSAGPRVLSGHTQPISCVAISSDSRWIAAGSNDGTARAWDLALVDPNANSRVLPGHQGGINCLAISPDSHWVITGGNDKTVRVWDLKAEGPTATPRVLNGHKNRVLSAVVSPDSRWVLSSGPGQARLWDLQADDPGARPDLVNNPEGDVGRVTMSADGRWLVAAGYDGAVRVWELGGDGPRGNPHILSAQGTGFPVAISPDNRWVVTASSSDKTAKIWDLTAQDPSANPRLLSGHQMAVSTLAISADGRWLVTGSADTTARIWDLKADDPAANPRVLQAHREAIHSVVISPDSRWVVTAGPESIARVWDLRVEDSAANPRVLTGHEQRIKSVLITDDNRWIVSASDDGSARIWDPTAADPSATARVLPGHPGSLTSAAMGGNNRWYVTGSLAGEVRVWDLEAEDPAANPRVLTANPGAVTCLALSPDSRWLAAGTVGTNVDLWDLAAGDPIANPQLLSGQQGPITSVAISPDEHWLITGTYDGTGQIWDLTADNPSDHARALPGAQGGLDHYRRVAISPDGRWLATWDSVLRIWDLKADDPIATPRAVLSHCHGGGTPRRVQDDPRAVFGRLPVIVSLAFSPDSRLIAAATSADATARIVDLTEPDPNANVRLLTGHRRGINCLAISADGRWVVTGSQDKTVRIWDLAAEDPSASPRVLTGHQDTVECVAISRDGHWIVTGSADNTVRIWHWQWDALVALAGRIGRNFDRDEWNRYFSNEPYRKTFADRWEPAAPPRRWEDNRDAGEDTQFVGGEGGSPRRIARPGELLRGIECEAGQFQGKPYITYLSPVFATQRPGRLPLGEMARDGYAVGAVNVDAERFVNAVQLVYMRITDDGRLDPNDSYSGEWLGTPVGEAQHALTGDGTPIIGVHLRKGVVVDALALVIERKARLVRRHEWPGVHVYHTACSPDGRYYLGGGDRGALRVWETATGEQQAEIPVPVGQFTPEGEHVVGHNFGKQILVFDLAGDNEPRQWEISEAVNSLAIAPDGKRVLSGHTDNILRLWDLDTGGEIRRFIGHEGSGEMRLVFSEDGKQILTASGADKTVRLWDVATGKLMQTYRHFADATPSERTSLIIGGFFLYGGRQIAGYVWGQSKRLLVWDMASGDVIRQFDLGSDFSKDLAISSDGQLFVATHEDNTVRIHDLSNGAELARVGMPVLPRGAIFSHDGRYVVSGGYRGWASLWRFNKDIQGAGGTD